MSHILIYSNCIVNRFFYGEDHFANYTDELIDKLDFPENNIVITVNMCFKYFIKVSKNVS